MSAFAGLSSQPSHLFSSSPVHTDLSLLQSLRILADARHSSVLLATALPSPSLNENFCASIPPPSDVARLCATAPYNLSAASANSLTPSTTSSAVIASSEMPDF